jgi:hypothetical protein
MPARAAPRPGLSLVDLLVHRLARLAMLVGVALASPAPCLADVVHHDIEVAVMLASRSIAVADRVTLSPGLPARFELAPALVPEVTAPWRLERLGTSPYGLSVYRVVGPPVSHGARVTFELRYSGQVEEGVDDSGVFLHSAQGWLPIFGDALVTSDLDPRLPEGWLGVSQGRSEGATWRETAPQQTIYLIAAPFERYARETPHGTAQVYLRSADPALAARYLDATGRYLALYSELIGPYPYAKFALVENTAQTGYGMASFTLLGSRVIRLSFMLDTSYPHEILHSWWGNGVYVDARRGNWSEGLTAYLADHLVAERGGRGARYRRATLQTYASYVARSRDFPVTMFRARHDRASQAVGYGKTMMLFHMLRRRLGDEPFVAGLRGFYDQWRHRRASFDDLRVALERATGDDLGPFVAQWLERTGAPRLRVRARREGEGEVVVDLEQVQDGAPYELDVPVVVEAVDGAVHRSVVSMRGARASVRLVLEGRAARLAVDPDFDLFRRLDPLELPPSLGELLGGDGALAVLPAGAPAPLRAAMRRLAGRLGAARVVDDTDEAAASEAPRLVLGWDSRLLPALAGLLEGHAVAVSALRAAHGEAVAERGAGACVLAAFRARGGSPGAWLACDDPTAYQGLARKLPHYGRYGFLVFTGTEPTNVARLELPVRASPLAIDLDTGSATTPPEPRVSRPLH